MRVCHAQSSWVEFCIRLPSLKLDSCAKVFFSWTSLLLVPVKLSLSFTSIVSFDRIHMYVGERVTNKGRKEDKKCGIIYSSFSCFLASNFLSKLSKTRAYTHRWCTFVVDYNSYAVVKCKKRGRDEQMKRKKREAAGPLVLWLHIHSSSRFSACLRVH